MIKNKIQIILVIFIYTFIKLSNSLSSSSSSSSTNYYEEKLHIYQLHSSPSLQKKLLHLEFHHKNFYDPSDILYESGILPRGIIDNLFINANSTNALIELGTGKFNQFYLQNTQFKFNLPNPGKAIYLEKYADYDKAITLLSSVFTGSKLGIANKNHYTVETRISDKSQLHWKNWEQDKSWFHGEDSNKREAEFEVDFPNEHDKFYFAFDPQDFICTDFLVAFRKLIPNYNNYGLMKILSHDIEIFRSEYLGFIINLAYNRHTKEISFKFDVFIIESHKKIVELLPEILKGSPYYDHSVLYCHYSSDIVDSIDISATSNYTNRVEITKEEFISKCFKQIESYNSATPIEIKPLLESSKFATGPGYLLDAKLIHLLKNNHPHDEIKTIHQELFTFQMQPSLHKLKILLNGTEDITNTQIIKVETDSPHTILLRFYLVIPPLSTLHVIIKFKKLIRGFENYPHDPERGEDIIPTPVFYTIGNHQAKSSTENKQKVYRILTENIIIDMPHPDFSMPFNIIALTLAATGFVYTGIFHNLFREDPKANAAKPSLIKRIISKLKEMFKKKKIISESHIKTEQ